jgi:hypothetical protein
MSVTATNAFSGPFLGTGAQTAFPYTFKALTANEVGVLVDGVEQGSSYTVTLGTNGNGGTITFDTAPASGVEILPFSQPSFEQNISFTNAGAFLPESHDEANDRSALRDIYIKGQLERTPKVPIGQTASPLPSPADSAGMYLAYGAGGAFVASSGTGADAGLRTDLAANTGGSLVGYRVALPGAVTRSVSDGLSLIIQAEDFGALPDGSDSGAAIQAGIDALAAAGGGVLTFASGATYDTSADILHKTGVYLLGNGTTIRTSSVETQLIDVAVSDCGAVGITFENASNNAGSTLFNIYGSGFTFEDVNFIKVPSAGGYIGYIRQGSSFGRFRNFTWAGSNGIFIAGHDHEFDGFSGESAFFDDALVIKSPISQTYNINIANGTVRNHSAAISIGSEVGNGGANDPAFAYYTRGITISNVRAYDCTTFAFLKGGGVEGNDYRDGEISGVTFTNCHMFGVRGSAFAYLLAARGNIVRDVLVDNCYANYRCLVASPNAFIKAYAYDYTGGSRAASIDRIKVRGSAFHDAAAGAAAGDGTFPVNNFVDVEIITGSGGIVPTIGRIEIIDTDMDGSSEAAIVTTNNIAGPIKIKGGLLSNYAVNPSSSLLNGAFSNASRISVRDIELTPAAGAQTGPSNGAPGSLGEIVGDREEIQLGDLAAGATIHRAFVAPRDCWIRRIYFLNSANIAVDAGNFITVTADNKDTGTNLVSEASSSGFNYSAAANTLVSLAANQFVVAAAYLSRGKALAITVSSTGTATLAGGLLVIEFVPYGPA